MNQWMNRSKLSQNIKNSLKPKGTLSSKFLGNVLNRINLINLALKSFQSSIPKCHFDGGDAEWTKRFDFLQLNLDFLSKIKPRKDITIMCKRMKKY